MPLNSNVLNTVPLNTHVVMTVVTTLPQAMFTLVSGLTSPVSNYRPQDIKSQITIIECADNEYQHNVSERSAGYAEARFTVTVASLIASEAISISEIIRKGLSSSLNVIIGTVSIQVILLENRNNLAMPTKSGSDSYTFNSVNDYWCQYVVSVP